MDSKKKIVVLGAGFGGLRAALLIAKKLSRLELLGKYEVALIDRNDHHTHTPLLYEIATTSKETANLCRLHEIATHNLSSLLHGIPITIIRNEVEGIEPVTGDIYLRGGASIRANYIVVALGSETNYFNIPGLREHTLPLKSFLDAVTIRDTIWNIAMERRGAIRVIVGGGGTTGVELAGELEMWCGQLKIDFPECGLLVTLIEAAPSILPRFAPRIISLAEKRLRALGVQLLTKETIVRLEPKKAFLESGVEVPFDLLIWSGGVRSPEILSRLPLKTESRGQLVVSKNMSCIPQTPDLKLTPRLYALGDSVCVYHPKTNEQILGVARAALSQATVAAHNVIKDIKVERGIARQPHYRTYRPREYPYIIPVGGKYAVAKIGPLIISGFFGWILKGLVELNYLLSIMPPWRALWIWFKGLKIFIQNDRLG